MTFTERGVHFVDWRMKLKKDDSVFQIDRDLIWRPRGDGIFFDENGFKVCNSCGNKNCDIICVGDSNTYGPAGDYGWPEYLNDFFHRTGVNVCNAGVWGYSSFQGLIRLSELIKLSPRIVIVSFGWNDGAKVYINDDEYVRSKKFLNAKMFNIKLIQLTNKIVDRATLLFKKNRLVRRCSTKDYEANLNKIIDLCSNNNSRVVLLTRPYRTGGFETRVFGVEHAEEYNKIVFKVAKARNVICVDLASYFNDNPKYFYDFAHFNDLGHKEAARLIYQALLK